MKKILFFFLGISLFANAQNLSNRLNSNFNIITDLSTSGTTSFWRYSNQYGVIPIKNPFVTFSAEIRLEYDSTNTIRKKKVDFGLGVNPVLNISNSKKILLADAYLKAKIGIFEIYVGRRKEIYGLIDSTLSSGAIVWSGNSLPIPQIQLSIPNYISILGKDIFSIKGSYSHGWFGESGRITNSYLHKKTFYGYLGKANWKIRLYGGFSHFVQWGGTVSNSLLNNSIFINDGKLPSSFRDYFYVITGLSLNQLRQSDKNLEKTYNVFDYTNRVGNHIGNIDIGLDIKLPNSQLFLYRQSIFDDGTLAHLGNISDGLLGCSIKLKGLNNHFTIKKLVFEYLNTTSQGGKNGPETGSYGAFLGDDDYFNHGQFVDGWSYKGSTLGTPFITPNLSTNGRFQQRLAAYNTIEGFTNNNRVSVFYVAVQALIGKFNVINRNSYSSSYGSYKLPFSKNIPQFSSIITTHYRINTKYSNIEITNSVSADIGKLFKNNIGFSLGIKRNWF